MSITDLIWLPLEWWGRSVPVEEPSVRRMIIREWMRVRGPRCPECNRVMEPRSEGNTRPTIDHTLARARGGTNDPRNLRVVCQSCNLTKGSLENPSVLPRLPL